MCLSWLIRLRWIAVAWIVVFWRLGYPALQDPDEAHYAQLTREMLRSGNWLVPLLDGKPFIDKPVLFHWLQGLSVTLLGESEFAARLPSAIAALALFWLVRWVGNILFDDPPPAAPARAATRIGEWGALMFATIPATFALGSLALFDMIFTAFLFGAVGCLLVAAKTGRRRVEWTGYLLLSLAMMTKGPVALILVGGFLGSAWLAGGALRRRVATLHWMIGLAAAALAAAPWFVWMYVRFGREFVEGYVLAGNLWYVTQPAIFSGRAVSHTFYARAFVGGFFPWSVVAAGRAVDVVRRRRTGLCWSVDEQSLWLWMACVVGFFSLARFKLDHYIFPAAPACCLIAAQAWRVAASAPATQARGTAAAIVTLAAALVVAGFAGGLYLFELNLELPAAAAILPILLEAGGVVLLAIIVRRGGRLPATASILIVMLLGVYAAGVAIGYPVLERTRPTALVARTLRRVASPDAPVALYKLSRWRASVRYYAERPIVAVESEEELRAMLVSNPRVYVILLRRDFEALRAGGMPLRAVARHRAVVGTTGRGLRRQQWGYLILATNTRAAVP